MPERRIDDQRINEIHESVALLVLKCETYFPKIQSIENTLNGNGNVGLKTRLAINEASIKKLWKFIWIPTGAAIIAGVKSWMQ